MPQEPPSCASTHIVDCREPVRDPQLVERRLRTQEKIDDEQEAIIRWAQLIVFESWLIPGLGYCFGWSRVSRWLTILRLLAWGIFGLPSDRKGEPEAGGCPGIASALTTSRLRARTFRFVKRNSIRSRQIGDPEPDFLVVAPDNRQQKTVQNP